MTEKLQAELKELKTNATISDVAKKLKTRDNVKDVVKKVKTFATIDKSDRAIERQHRSYITYSTDDKHAEVYYTTTYLNNNVETQLNIAIMRSLVKDFIQKLQAEKFTVSQIQKFYSIKGCNYGDIPRLALQEISLDASKHELETNLSALKATAIAKNKLLIRVNILEDSHKKLYEFIKV